MLCPNWEPSLSALARPKSRFALDFSREPREVLEAIVAKFVPDPALSDESRVRDPGWLPSFVPPMEPEPYADAELREGVRECSPVPREIDFARCARPAIVLLCISIWSWTACRAQGCDTFICMVSDLVRAAPSMGKRYAPFIFLNNPYIVSSSHSAVKRSCRLA